MAYNDDFCADIDRFLRNVHAELKREVFTTAFVRDLGEGVARVAKSKLGDYQEGWPELSEWTKERREREGYPPNDPLLVTGELRASIRVVTRKLTHSVDAYVGSDAPQARVQELGGFGIPPRPYLRPALIEQTPNLGRKVAQQVQEACEVAAGKVFG